MNVTSSTPGRNVLSFKLSGSEKMRIASDGSVGIGTAAPATTLDVSGTTTLKGTTNLSNNNIINIGNAGIGTAAPAYKLDVIGSGSDSIVCRLQSGGANTATTYVNTGASNLDVGTGSGGHFIYGYGSYPLYFGVNGSEKMRITSAGNVGIGTSTPSQILQVGDGGRMRVSNGTTDYTLIGTKETDDASNTRIVLSGYDRTGQTGGIEYIATNTGVHVFRTSNSGAERMRITSDGSVGIGTSSPGYTFYVTGTKRSYSFSDAGLTRNYDYALRQNFTDTNVIAGFNGAIYSDGHWTLASDYRIKTNFSDINNSIQTIRELHPVTYYNIDYNKNDGRKKYGFIAQEVRKKLPDAITERCDAVPTSYFHGKIVQNTDGTTISIQAPEPASNSANSTILLNTALLICDCDKEVCFEGVQVDGYARFKIFGGETNADPYDIYIWNSNGKNCKDGKYTYQIGMKAEESETICRNPCVFIYGQYVNDFHTLEYNVIWAVTTAALQEVDRQQQADKVRIAELETEVVSLKQELDKQKTLINSILERLAI